MTANLLKRRESAFYELRHELAKKDWGISRYAGQAPGVALTFRRRYTSNVPGVETRERVGQNDVEVLRLFLIELDEEQTG